MCLEFRLSQISGNSVLFTDTDFATFLLGYLLKLSSSKLFPPGSKLGRLVLSQRFSRTSALPGSRHRLLMVLFTLLLPISLCFSRGTPNPKPFHNPFTLSEAAHMSSHPWWIVAVQLSVSCPPVHPGDCRRAD